MSKPETEHSTLVRILQAMQNAGAAGLTTGQLAELVGAPSKVVANAVWYQRKVDRLATDEAAGRHTITDIGRRYLESVLSGVNKSTRKRSHQRASRRTGKVVAVATRQIPERPPIPDRATQAGRHADDLIANARAAIDVHEALLDESVELTPLVRSTIDGIRRSITLIESAYQVARA